MYLAKAIDAIAQMRATSFDDHQDFKCDINRYIVIIHLFQAPQQKLAYVLKNR
jgi:hypothetical protein